MHLLEPGRTFLRIEGCILNKNEKVPLKGLTLSTLSLSHSLTLSLSHSLTLSLSHSLTLSLTYTHTHIHTYTHTHIHTYTHTHSCTHTHTHTHISIRLKNNSREQFPYPCPGSPRNVLHPHVGDEENAGEGEGHCETGLLLTFL